MKLLNPHGDPALLTPEERDLRKTMDLRAAQNNVVAMRRQVAAVSVAELLSEDAQGLGVRSITNGSPTTGALQYRQPEGTNAQTGRGERDVRPTAPGTANTAGKPTYQSAARATTRKARFIHPWELTLAANYGGRNDAA